MAMLAHGHEQDKVVFLLRRSKEYQALWKKHTGTRSNGGLHIADDMLDSKPPCSHVMGRSRK